jgi:hypothetical protein
MPTALIFSGVSEITIVSCPRASANKGSSAASGGDGLSFLLLQGRTKYALADTYLIMLKHDCERSASIALGPLAVGLSLITCSYLGSCHGLRCCIALLHHLWSPVCSTISFSRCQWEIFLGK